MKIPVFSAIVIHLLAIVLPASKSIIFSSACVSMKVFKWPPTSKLIANEGSPSLS